MRKNYKNSWSNYRTWEKKEHATEHMIYPDNITESIAIDELTLSKGELYTYVTAKDKKGVMDILEAGFEDLRSNGHFGG